ncbi:MAG TPA: type VI secretion system baseplate subunit TssF, partial [Candidatus Krumholzibacteria bacterium]|nr:type VI secretion system baseplate subunit TssF [Candidatus Krumholzibacteria bacterium]
SAVELGETSSVDRTALRITLSSRNGTPLVAPDPMPAELPILLFWSDLAHTCTVRRCLANMPAPPRFVAIAAKGGQESVIEKKVALRVRRPMEHEPMLTAGRRAFPGFRMMREFFALPQRFMQFVITGLDTCEELQEAGALRIEATLPLSIRDLPPFDVKNFLPFTSAVCNEWSGSAKPIHYDGTRETYALEADHAGGAEILRVESVRMLPRGADSFTPVEPFNYYNREIPSYRPGSESYHLSESRRRVRWNLDLNNLAPPGTQVVVGADLALANADAHEVLGARAVLANYEGVPEDLAANTIAPSTEFTPALEAEGQYWQLVDMVASSLSAMASPLRLQMFLLHLNRTDNHIMAGAIRGIKGVELRMTTTTLRQQPLKVATMQVDIDRGEYLNSGFIEVFFDAFYGLLEEFVPLNCSLELEVRDADTKKVERRWLPEGARYTWT